MGNCCCPQTDENQALNSGGTGNRAAFQGEGHRLGTAQELSAYQNSATSKTDASLDDAHPKPVVDSNLTEEERERIRNDRAAAAEARLKKMGGATKPKKKPPSDAPLRGPNSKPTMTWTTG